MENLVIFTVSLNALVLSLGDRKPEHVACKYLSPVVKVNNYGFQSPLMVVGRGRVPCQELALPLIQAFVHDHSTAHIINVQYVCLYVCVYIVNSLNFLLVIGNI